jgi:hypothetical protein
MRPFRRADSLSPQILYGPDPALPVHDRTKENRNNREQITEAPTMSESVLLICVRKLGERELRQIEFAVGREAREAFVMPQSEPVYGRSLQP